MSHNILLTGASGYLGGTILARLSSANLPPYGKLFALVRSDEQAEGVKRYGAEPLKFNANDATEVQDVVVNNEISIIYYLIDFQHSHQQVNFIHALAEVKKATGKQVHIIHTSGAKMFSNQAGTLTNRPLRDNELDIYQIQKNQKAPYTMLQNGTDTNNTVIDTAESLGVRSYIFAPSIVYGKGEGFGNQISIQTTAIVKAALCVKRVYSTDSGRPSWPILRVILEGGQLDYGKNGYYLAATGSVVWEDLYSAMAQALKKRGVLTDDSVTIADDATLERMGEGLGCPKDMVPLLLGGRCTFTAEHGKEIGWQPEFRPEHILEDADAEVELVLQSLT
ncbi:hypothetical protein TruAng_011807 [Truncatella angustata]|nr:hypothetical protein TruAng_011807 [Truncatella angustata]